MVNPPKDETVRIRNVFYWFQNRRSRSRRRQRQIQASLEQRNQAQLISGATQFESSSALGLGPLSSAFASSPSSCHFGSSSSSGGVLMGNDGVDHCMFSVSGQISFPEIEQGSTVTPGLCTPSDTLNLQYQSGKCMADLIPQIFIQLPFFPFQFPYVN
jgi:hypothetical protein